MRAFLRIFLPAFVVFLLGLSTALTQSRPADLSTDGTAPTPMKKSTLLPEGPFSVVGNQIVTSSGRPVRLACVGYNEPHDPPADMARMVSEGFNCARADWYDANLDLDAMDTIVAAAAVNGIKMIFNHHGNEHNSSCLGQQENGLWYDLNGPAPYDTTNNTDGCPNPAYGTVTYATFKANWVTIAQHYAGNPTVIGFDLDNEPLTYGLDVTSTANWGSGDGSDLHAMYEDVGSAVEAADPGVLIIAEGPINFGPNLLNGKPTAVGILDLSMAHEKPVVLTVRRSHPPKVVYSVHEYPRTIGGSAFDSGPEMTTARNNAWGYLEAMGYAPVWIGEMGASLDGLADSADTTNTPTPLADEQAWAADLVAYLNGQAPDGPRFRAGEQPFGTDWWAEGNLAGQYPDGTFTNNTENAAQAAVYSQLRQ
jgi:endoglucanase